MDRSGSPLGGLSNRSLLLVALAPVTFLTAFFVYPITSILWRGATADIGALLESFGKPTFVRVVWFTIWQAVASTALTVVIALPTCHLLALHRFPGRSALRAATTVPFVLPTVVVGGAFTALFDWLGLAGGVFHVHHTIWAVLLAHVFLNVAVVIRTVGSFWEGMGVGPEEQARSLGASPWQAFRWVTLPRLGPALASAASIVFLFCLTSFGVILILGGPTMATLETEVWRHAVLRGDLPSATALAVVQLVAVVAAVAVTTRLQRRLVGPRRQQAGRLPKPDRRLLAANLAGLGLLIGLPVAVLLERSLSINGGYSFRNYSALADRVDLLPVSSLVALSNSLLFATLATGLAVLVGGLTSVVVVHGRHWTARLLDLGMTLPLGASAVTLGFGMLIALDEPPLDIRSSRWLVPVAHALVGVPFVIRILVPTLRSVDARLREAAAVLGASPTSVRMEVDLPIAWRGLLVGAGFAFAVSIGEFGATSFLPRSPDRLTAPLALFRLLGTPGEALRGQAMALAVVLMGLTACAVLAIERVRGPIRGSL